MKRSSLTVARSRAARRATAPTAPAPRTLSGELVELVTSVLERLRASHLPGWRIPGVFAGYEVRSDAHADLAFTLGLLHQQGVRVLGGRPLPESIGRCLQGADGSASGPFAAYRLAETLTRFGRFAGNRLLDRWRPGQRRRLALACDAGRFTPLLEAGRLPRNQVAVLARGELARARLGLVAPGSAREQELLRRTRALLAAGDRLFFDDSENGSGRYDIYMADLYLFTESFRDRLGPAWERGARAAIRLVEETGAGASQGAAIAWGRSGGVLALCATIELAALALRDRLTGDRAGWARAARAVIGQLPGWFAADGLVVAHQNRSPDAYRGAHRRMQFTFDCLGKLAWSALALGDVPAAAIDGDADRRERQPGLVDRLLWLDRRRNAAVWRYRSRELAFVLPVVGSTLGEYLPAPRHPGLFEVPAEVDLPVGTPLVFDRGVRFVGGHLPVRIRKARQRLTVDYAPLVQSGQWTVDERTPRLEARRSVSYTVRGRTLEVTERLEAASPPRAVGVQIAEAAGRPLRVRFACPSPHTVTSIDTAGVKEYRSSWGELPRVHQIDLRPRRRLRFSYRITPKVRVLSSAPQQPYHRTIYDHLHERVHETPVNGAIGADLDNAALEAALRGSDLFHLHWPEWFLPPDVGLHARFIEKLRQCGLKIAWTQHNLLPHTKELAYQEIYQLWAQATDAAIHHSRWGMAAVKARYRFRAGAIHRVIPHPHFRSLAGGGGTASRPATEAKLGLGPGKLRLTVLGAPRKEKQTALVMEAFAACGRRDLELLVLSGGADERAPVHPGLVVRRHRPLPRAEFDAVLAATDVLVLFHARTGMLTTGLVGEVIGSGIPALVSDWPFLREVLGQAAIPGGATAGELAARLRVLNRSTVARAARAAARLRRRHDPRRVADLTGDLFEAMGACKL